MQVVFAKLIIPSAPYPGPGNGPGRRAVNDRAADPGPCKPEHNGSLPAIFRPGSQIDPEGPRAYMISELDREIALFNPF